MIGKVRLVHYLTALRLIWLYERKLVYALSRFVQTNVKHF